MLIHRIASFQQKLDSIPTMSLLVTLSTCLFAMVAACAAEEGSAGDEVARGDLMGTDGARIGEFTFTQGTGGLLLYVEVQELTPGGHGIHLHSVGACSPDFKAAQGHINTRNAEHGLLNPRGIEDGDLPNIYAGADGMARAEMFTTLIAVEDLLDDDGSSIVIHAQPDDHITQPIGGAGSRVGCGVIEKS